MQIKSIELTNFRNLKSESFAFGKRTAIEGKNHIGKTNVLEAIHWALTGYLLDGSYDSPSIIPIGNRKAKVEVKIVTDEGHEFIRSYGEHWGTTRGNVTETLIGHDEGYRFDGARITSKASATTKLNELIAGTDYQRLSYDREVELPRALVNPLYLTEQVSWQVLRKFIVSLCGEISNDDVFANHQEFAPLKKPLAEASGKADFLAEKTDSEISDVKQSIATSKSVIDVLSEDVCPKNSDVDFAKTMVETIRKGEEEIKEGKKTDPVTDAMKQDLQKKKNHLAEIDLEISKLQAEANRICAERTEKNRNAVSKAQQEVDDLTKQRREIDTADDDLNRQLKSAQSLLEIAKERIDSLRNDYSEAKGATFTFSEVKCPKCGTVLNEDEEKREKQDFDNSKQKKLLELIEKGKAAKTELTKQQSLVDSLNKRKSENSDARKKELDVAIINASKSLDIKRQILNGEMNPDPVEYSEDPKKLEEEISELEKKISQAETETSSDINERLEKYRQSTISNLSMAQQVLDELTVYNDAQRKIADENVKLNELNHRLNQELELKDMISGFIRVKLEMINASTKKVFPDIDFVLVRPNIKEGSWDEVCYPLIKGKKTPFADGSGSEKIVTSLAIIEDVRKALGLEDTVLIFDEGETLDSETIKSLDTESQVITSVVNDSYSEPTAVVLGK